MKLLIVRVGALGDILHALPAVAALHARQPGWQIDWVVDPRWAPLLADAEGRGPVVHRVHYADTRLWSRAPFSRATLGSILALRRELRAAHYDIALDMQGTLRSAVIARLSGAPVRAGYRDPREAPAGWFYTRRHPRHARHVVEQGAELLTAAFDLPLPLLPVVTPLSHEPSADASALAEAPPGSRLALLAPGAGWAAKQWPATNFAVLARELRGHGFEVAVTAPRQDDETALRVVAESGPPGSPAARMVVGDVTALVALTRRAALVVGGDSGPTHLAAALGIPLVALFGPTDPARNGPAGAGPRRILRDPASPTSYKHTAAADPGLARISVEQVLQAALDVTAPSAVASEGSALS